MNALPSEQVALAATIDPGNLGVATHTSDWVDMADFESVMATVYAGTLGASATIDAKLEQATDSSGSGAKDVSGKAITQMDTSSPSDSDNQAVINCRDDELDASGGFRYVRLSMTVGTAASDAAGAVYGVYPSHKPASDNDLGSVLEIVS